jgi:hypothetical protein
MRSTLVCYICTLALGHGDLRGVGAAFFFRSDSDEARAFGEVFDVLANAQVSLV